MRQHKILLLLITLISGIIIANKSKVTINEANANGLMTYEQEPPTLGSPDDYSPQDNLSFIAYNVTHSKSFDTETNGTVEALGGIYKQNVKNTRIVNDGKAFTEAISTSSFVKRYEQKFFYGNNEKILVRNEDRVDGDKIIWKNEVTAISKETYDERYGWYPTWLIGYIVHPDSINNASMTKSGDNYIITCDMNINIAPAYNQYEMKTYAGSSENPSFNSLKLTFTFSNDWVLKTVLENANYQINIPGLNWLTCESSLIEEFHFRDTQIPDLEFFMSNIDKEIGEIEESLDALAYLQNAFGPYIIDKELNLSGSIEFNNKIHNINVLADIRGLKNIKINALIDNLYIGYLDNKLYLKNKEQGYYYDLTSVGNLESSTSSFDTSMLSNLSLKKENGNIIINLPIDKINVEFIIDEKTASLKEINASIYENINIHLKPSNVKINYPTIDSSFKDLSSSKWLIDKFKEILGYESILINATSNISISNTSYNLDSSFIYSNNIVKGVVNLTNNNDSFTFNIYYDDYLYLSFNNINIKLSKDEITKLIHFDSSNIETPNSSFIFDITSTNDIINILINTYLINFKNEENLHIETNDLNIIIKEADIDINYEFADNYLTFNEIDKIKDLVESIIDISKSNYSIDLSTNLNISNIDIGVYGNILLSNDFEKFTSTFKVNVLGTLNKFDVSYYNNYFYISYGNINLKLSVDEIKELSNTTPSNDESISIIALSKILDSIVVDSNITINLNVFDTIYPITINNENGILITSNEISTSSITLKDTKLNLTKSDEEIIINEFDEYLDYESINILIDYINCFKDLANNEKISFDFETAIYKDSSKLYTANANVGIIKTNNSFDLYVNLLIEPADSSLAQISANGYIDIKLRIINEYVYLDFNGIKMKCSLIDLKKTIQSALSIFGIQNDLIDTLLNLEKSDISNDNFISDSLNQFIKFDDIELSSYIDSLYVNNASLTLNLDSYKLFNESGKTSIQILKDSSINELKIDNLYSTKGENFDLLFTLTDSSSLSIAEPDNIDSYMDFSTANQFINDLYNTANKKSFELSGSINLNISILVNIQAASVNYKTIIELNDDGSLKNIGIYIKTPSVITNKSASLKDTEAWIYYENNMLYMKRKVPSTNFIITSTKVEYTSATLDEFNSRMLDYIYWLTDLSSSITSQITSNQTSDITRTFEHSFISYSYDNNCYKLSLNGENLAETSMIGNINLNLYRNTDGLLTSINGSIDKLGSSVIKAAFTIDNNLTPSSVTTLIDYIDKINDFTSLSGYVTI